MPPEQMDRELLKAALVGLEHRRDDLAEKISELRRMLGGRATSDSAGTNVSPAPVRRRRMSAAGRARIAEAQRKRWAAAKGTSSHVAKKTMAKRSKSAAPKKRQMSPEGRKRIIAATKKRWAAFRAAKESTAKETTGKKSSVKMTAEAAGE